MILRPSDTTRRRATSFAVGGERETARLRGLLVHRLLQSLPDIAAERRRKVAEDYLAGRDANCRARTAFASQSKSCA